MLCGSLCPYCGKTLSGCRGVDWNWDHIISRRMVPRGSLDGERDNKVKCCYACNSEKSRYEQITSAYTLWRDRGTPNQGAEVQGKLSGTRHPSTGKSFRNSIGKLNITSKFGGLILNAEMAPNIPSPPQEILVGLGVMIVKGVICVESWPSWQPIAGKPFHCGDWGHYQLVEVQNQIKAASGRKRRTFGNGIVEVVVSFGERKLGLVEINKRLRVAVSDCSFPRENDFQDVSETVRVRQEKEEEKYFLKCFR
jgi:hypothetical protein